MNTQKPLLTWIGWIITALVSLLMTFSAAMKLLNPPELAEQFVNKLGYPKHVTVPIGIVEAACVIVYLFPRTAILGAVLLTGYLGGAVATHVRVDDPFFSPVIVGIFVWLGIFFREPRLRALIPWRAPGKQ